MLSVCLVVWANFTVISVTRNMQVLGACTDSSSTANLEKLLNAGARQVSHHASLTELHFKNRRTQCLFSAQCNA